jgi:hypothetical protein
MSDTGRTQAELSRLRETMRLLRLVDGLLSTAYAIEQHGEYGQRVFDAALPVSELLRQLEKRMGELGRIVQGHQQP